MISDTDLIELVQRYNPKSNADMIRSAYALARDMHEGQTRKSGEPYFTHPVAVAEILAGQRLDDDTIVTALLHDTIEDTRADYALITDRFGTEVADLVEGVTNLTNLELNSVEAKQAENFRKLFMAMSRDLRVILVKLADRLHNMRTIEFQSPQKRQQKARETMDIFAPLAGRIGMQWMRDELEDLSFAVLNPDMRKSVMTRFARLKMDSGNVIDDITADIRSELDRIGVHGEVQGRAKRPYSIWRKMELKDEPFSRLADIFGFRIITESEDDCYRALGAIHQRWRAVPGRFKDYISQPKENGYRSIHTTVSGRRGKRVEVQIRTRQMHDVAESGIAAHWSYRDGARVDNPFAVDPVKWIANLTAEFTSEPSSQEFLEAVKLEMYSAQVFCFTPKGDVIKLPRSATPIDFAYAIHTRIGNACVGAKIDGRRVPLWTQLRNGRTVEIITAAGNVPQATWLEMAVTGKARSAIRRGLREARAERLRTLGRELARAAFARVGKKATDKALGTAARLLQLGSGDEVLVRLGSAELKAGEVVRALYPDLVPAATDRVALDRAVVGLQAGQWFERALCCNPVPGERIVGISYRGRGVIVHAIDCVRLVDYEEQHERWVDLHWTEGRHAPEHEATLELTLGNDAGVLGRVCTLIGETDANISNIEFLDRKPDFYRLLVYVMLRDAQHLHMLITALEAESDVAQVGRYRDPSRLEKMFDARGAVA